jgi:ketosteroid isomerase-like protein
VKLITGREEKVFRRALLLVLLAAVTLIVACSNSQPDQQQAISDQVGLYVQAVESRDWEQVCQTITAESQALILQQSKAPGCPQAYRRLSPQDRAVLQESATDAQVSKVQVSGQQATVTMNTKQGTAAVPLVKEDGQWLVNLVAPDPAPSATGQPGSSR